MIRTIWLHYVVHGQPVVLGFNMNGELISLHKNNVDFTENGEVAQDIINALTERGVNLGEAISLAFARAQSNQSVKSGAS